MAYPLSTATSLPYMPTLIFCSVVVEDLVSCRTSWGSSPRPPFSRFARRAVTGRAWSLLRSWSIYRSDTLGPISSKKLIKPPSRSWSAQKRLKVMSFFYKQIFSKLSSDQSQAKVDMVYCLSNSSCPQMERRSHMLEFLTSYLTKHKTYQHINSHKEAIGRRV